jgi:hypothetical protein
MADMKSHNFMKNLTIPGLFAALAVVVRVGNAQEPYPSAAPPPRPPPGQPAAIQANLSPGAAEVVRLAQSGVTEDVVLAYVQNSQASFNLSADGVVYVRDVGLSSAVITAMLNHDNALRSQAPPPSQYQPQQQYQPPPPPQQYQPLPSPPPYQPPTATVPVEPPSTVPVEAPLVPPSEPAYVGNPPADVNYFYDDLTPYGSWVTVEGVGWCWQPRVVVVNHAWRPYCDGGHWIYTDAGWYWQSDYSWGWAPFHYGRWTLSSRCGWVWVPDTVWGPSWVVWRTSGDYCGWAPIPPHAVFDVHTGWVYNGIHVGFSFDFGLHADHYSFVHYHDFCEHEVGIHRVHTTEVTKIYNNTTIINNYSINNNTIVNHGVAVERVASLSRVAVPRATVHAVAESNVKNAHIQPAQRGATSVVYRPEHLTPPARHTTTAIVAQKVDAQHPVVHNDPVVHNTTVVTSAGVSRSVTPRGVRQPAPATPTPGTRQPAPVAPSNPGRAPANQYTPAPKSSVAAPAGPQQVHATPAAPSTTTTRSSAQVAPLTPPRETQTRTVEQSRTSAPQTPVTRAEPTVQREAPAAHEAPLVPRSEPAQARVQSAPAWGAVRETPAQNPHVYYPKTYNQSAGVSGRPQSAPGQQRDYAPSQKTQPSPNPSSPSKHD